MDSWKFAVHTALFRFLWASPPVWPMVTHNAFLCVGLLRHLLMMHDVLMQKHNSSFPPPPLERVLACVYVYLHAFWCMRAIRERCKCSAVCFTLFPPWLSAPCFPISHFFHCHFQTFSRYWRQTEQRKKKWVKWLWCVIDTLLFLVRGTSEEMALFFILAFFGPFLSSPLHTFLSV